MMTPLPVARECDLDARCATGRALPGLRLMAAPSSWLQFDVHTAERSAELYTRLAGMTEWALSTRGVLNVFSMNKSPGVRMRFEVSVTQRFLLERDLARQMAALVGVRGVTAVSRAVYEPEAHLFGGPVSMRSVHRLFTADTQAWLGYRRLIARSEAAGPAWAFSLSLLSGLFDAMGVTGWESRDVWDRVRRDTGRGLADGARDFVEFAATVDLLQKAWSDDRLRSAQLSPAAQALVDIFAADAAVCATDWHAEYFSSGHAYVGPRQALAYYVAYHWNRAEFSDLRQCVITAALADGPS